MTAEGGSRQDRELWRGLALARDAAPASVPDMDFAAWLEGRLSEADAARVEAAVAIDPESRRAALELAEILGEPLPPIPDRMIIRAQALVDFTAGRDAAAEGFWRRIFPISANLGLQRAVTATVALIIAGGGFVVGGGLGESFGEQQGYSATESGFVSVSSDTSNEVSEFFAPDGI